VTVVVGCRDLLLPLRPLPAPTLNMASSENTEPFPFLPQSSGISSAPGLASPPKPIASKTEPSPLERKTSNTSGLSQSRRTSSWSQSFLNSNPPFGICQATGEVASKVPTLGEIRNGSFSAGGWTEEGQLEGRGETPHQIQKRRTSRASSLCASRRRRSTTSPLSTRADEQEDFFPTFNRQLSDEANRVPSTIPEATQTGTGSKQM
jgi:hypothetical protein